MHVIFTLFSVILASGLSNNKNLTHNKGIHNLKKGLVICSAIYSRTPLFRSPKGNGKKLQIAGLRNKRGSVKGKGKSKGIRSSFEIVGTSN